MISESHFIVPLWKTKFILKRKENQYVKWLTFIVATVKLISEDARTMADVKSMIYQLCSTLHVEQHQLEREKDLRGQLENLKVEIEPMEKVGTQNMALLVDDKKQPSVSHRLCIMPSPSWSCSLYPTTVTDAKFHVTKRNQSIFPSSLALVSLVWMGEKPRWPPHDKGLYKSFSCLPRLLGRIFETDFMFQLPYPQPKQLSIHWISIIISAKIRFGSESRP